MDPQSKVGETSRTDLAQHIRGKCIAPYGVANPVEKLSEVPHTQIDVMA